MHVMHVTLWMKEDDFVDLNKLFFLKTSKQKNSREPRTKGKSMHWDSGGGRAIVCTVAKNACFFFFIYLFVFWGHSTSRSVLHPNYLCRIIHQWQEYRSAKNIFGVNRHPSIQSANILFLSIHRGHTCTIYTQVQLVRIPARVPFHCNVTGKRYWIVKSPLQLGNFLNTHLDLVYTGRCTPANTQGYSEKFLISSCYKRLPFSSPPQTKKNNQAALVYIFFFLMGFRTDRDRLRQS